MTARAHALTAMPPASTPRPRASAFATLAAVVALAGGAIGACALLDDPPPENRCTGDADCFRAQGESCNVDAGICELRGDAGP